MTCVCAMSDAWVCPQVATSWRGSRSVVEFRACSTSTVYVPVPRTVYGRLDYIAGMRRMGVRTRTCKQKHTQSASPQTWEMAQRALRLTGSHRISPVSPPKLQTRSTRRHAPGHNRKVARPITSRTLLPATTWDVKHYGPILAWVHEARQRHLTHQIKSDGAQFTLR